MAEIDGLDNWMELDYHPLCTVFPQMSDDEFDALVNSMIQDGYHESDPIVVVRDPDLRIIDGRNRHLAAMEARVVPTFTELADEVDLVGWVTSRNTTRRMLTAGQRAAVASDIARWDPGTNQFSDAVEASVTLEQASKLAGCNITRVKEYRVIQERDPVSARLVREGKLSITPVYTKLKEKPEPQDSPPPDAPEASESASPVAQEQPWPPVDEEKVVPLPGVPDATEKTGSENMDFDTATQAQSGPAIQYTAWWDPEHGRVCIRMGDEKNVYSLRPDTASALGEAILDSCTEHGE